MGSGKFSDPLQDYLDSLLADNPSGVVAPVTANQLADATALKFAAGDNIAALPATRPARAIPARPYAEPIRTLNLRMPLPTVAPTAPVVEAVPAVKTELRAAPVIPVESPAPAVAQADAEALSPADQSSRVTDLATMAPPVEWLSNGRPKWAQQPFECLIFKAGGLQLAAPLIELGSIYPLEEKSLTEIFGQKQWFIGLLSVKEYNVRAMDTALVVMPERYSAAMREDYRYIVTLFGSDWGLAVDAVVGTVVLDPEHIRWRAQRTKRPWLAGTLIDQMCALFDISQLAWLFHNQDRKRASI